MAQCSYEGDCWGFEGTHSNNFLQTEEDIPFQILISNYIKIQIITSLTKLITSIFTKSSSTYFMYPIFVHFPDYFIKIAFPSHILYASESVLRQWYLPSWLRYSMKFRVPQSSTLCPQDPANIPYPVPVTSNYSYIISIILLFHTNFCLFWGLSRSRLSGFSPLTFCKHHAS